eukprot:7071372-Pyramimonas_sp.AAC.1
MVDAQVAWRTFSAPMPGGRHAPCHASVDRDRFEIAREPATMCLREKVQEFLGGRINMGGVREGGGR